MPIVRPYVRSDGTPVRGHTRWAPGARREMTVFAVFCLAVLGFGNTSTADGTDSQSPTPSVTYPIRFDPTTNDAPRLAVPHPTVSYPIRFDTPTPRTAAPAPSVSYPIDLSALGGGR
ncbi:hypothetical protein B0E37_01497 [Streptomyces sp. MH192]|nr:hypothetical protein [Streptomyces sp. MH192]MCF0098061.1 hypothetical protein [Streptomyces sp. MH191]